MRSLDSHYLFLITLFHNRFIDVFSYLAYYQVSAQPISEVQGKLAFLRAYECGCICDAVATEELCSEVHLRALALTDVISH